jgi:hypothetical protein
MFTPYNGVFSPLYDVLKGSCWAKACIWNAFLVPLSSVHLTQGPDDFHWNLNENEKFSFESIYKASIQPVESVFNNKLI